MVQGFGPLTLGHTAVSMVAFSGGVWASILLARRAGLMDLPNERSSYTIPTLRMGGVPMVAAAVLVFDCWAFMAAGEAFSRKRLPSSIFFVLGMAVLKNAREGVATYILKDREDYSTRTVYGAICRELERKPRLVPVPARVVRFGGMLSEDFRKLAGSFRVSSARIERDFGFYPLFSLEEGIARTVEWYRNTGQRL